MNTTIRFIAAAAIATLGSAAFAQEATPDTWISGAKATKSIEQVKAELTQARKDGSIKSGSANYDYVGRTQATKSRDQVKAELAAAQASGEYAALNREAADFRSVPPAPVYAKSAK
jgi:hypothetical protein